MQLNLSLGLVFLAGIASFLSPCVFALVPAYVGYLGGRAAGSGGNGRNRFHTFVHGLAFVFGFSVVFILLGIGASSLGVVLQDVRLWLARLGGVVIILLGLHMTGIFRIHFLEFDKRVQVLPDSRLGYLSSMLVGIFFSAGWSPCVGPVLGAILTFVMNGGSIGYGALSLAVYSAGLAIPFLLAALGIGWVSVILHKYGKITHYVEVGMGILMVIVGTLLLFGGFNLIVPGIQL